MSIRIGLVGCVKEKRAVIASAGDLYTSTLFSGRRDYVERSCTGWYVLSAKHGLLRPEVMVAPYDESLNDAGRAARRAWSEWVLRQLVVELGPLGRFTFEIHAGANYRDFGLTERLHLAGARFEVPAAGLRQGEQLAFYSRGRKTGKG